MSLEGWVLQGGQWHVVVVGIVVAFMGHADGVGQSCQTSSSILNIQKIQGVVLVLVIVVWMTLSVVGGIGVVAADAAPICSQRKARKALVLFAVWRPKSKGSLVLGCRGHEAWFCVVVGGGGGRSVEVVSWGCSGWFLGGCLLMLLLVVVPDLAGGAVR